MGATSEEYLRKLQEFEKLIRYASYRYRIPGVLDPEDLYQEGLIILNDMFRKYDCHSDSEDFRKLFKTELWHGLWKVLQRHKQSKRDHRVVVHGDYSFYDQAADDDRTSCQSDAARATAYSPEDLARAKQDEEEVSEFIERLINRLDDEARIVLSELLYPRSWQDVPEELRSTASDYTYERRPKRGPPRHIVADLLGWPRIRVKRAVKRIRRVATEVAQEFGTTAVSKAGLKWLTDRQRRKDDRRERRTQRIRAQSLSGSSVLQSESARDCLAARGIDIELRLENVFPKERVECVADERDDHETRRVGASDEGSDKDGGVHRSCLAAT